MKFKGRLAYAASRTINRPYLTPSDAPATPAKRGFGRRLLCRLFRRAFGCYLPHWLYYRCRDCDFYEHNHSPPEKPANEKEECH